MGGVEVGINAQAKAVFDPSFGYGLYLPSTDFNLVTTKLNSKLFKDLKSEETFLVCDDDRSLSHSLMKN
jgi:hypothetical protein